MVNNFVIYNSGDNPCELGFVMAVHVVKESIIDEEIDSVIAVIKPLDERLSLRYVNIKYIKQMFKEVQINED